ncbi:diguanylate cyclase (GGDEF)-like protein [Natronocella acetinitrilica]|uniref:Diguanylate cyclase (GGDEF)-like protein n=1 Tax=Natronocella acetinitrilica TaxID=414046 RepID=A0AAE3G292_9GAMM|nr:diguanylate cyclase [Natronocella acetinitrilica]MCP1674485.1 diguanylate cyclase (GGDEF)-like protein [Natronocella acetinitrilica]
MAIQGIPGDEGARLALLEELRLLEGGADRLFEGLTALARSVAGCEHAFVSLVGADQQHLVASLGIAGGASSRAQSFCTHVIDARAPLVIEDTLADPRFCDNPAVTGAPHLRFYVGLPLVLDVTVSPLATLCVSDTAPRPGGLSDEAMAQLRLIARLAEERLRTRRSALRAARLQETLTGRDRMLEVIQRLSGAGFMVLDAALVIRECNAAMATLLECEPASLAGESVLTITHAPLRARAEATLQGVLRGGIRARGEWAMLDASGAIRGAEVRVERLVLEGAPCLVCVAGDSTAARRSALLNAAETRTLSALGAQASAAEVAAPVVDLLREHRPGAGVVFSVLREGALEVVAARGVDAHALTTALCAASDTPAREVLLHDAPVLLLGLDDHPRWPQALHPVFEAGFCALWCLPVHDEDRTMRGVLTLALPGGVLPATRELGFLEAMAAAAGTALARLELLQALDQRAHQDSLTGLGNRHMLRDALPQALYRGAREASPTALMLLDLDRFKQINDTHGHAAGDALLVEVARRLRAVVRERDHVVRLGGDEFVLVLQGCDRALCEWVARRIAARFEEAVAVGALSLRSRPSIGIALAEPGDVDAEALLAAADRAMYAAKAAGRGTHRFAGDASAEHPASAGRGGPGG